MSSHETDELSSLPPASKLVLKVLECEGRLTNQEISEHSWLSKRTVRTALQRLEHANMVEKQICLDDARKNWYKVKPNIEMQGSD